MTLFLEPASPPERTRYFVRRVGDAQVLVVEALCATTTDNWVIVPLPVRPGWDAEVLASGPSIFALLEDHFPRVFAPLGGAPDPLLQPPAPWPGPTAAAIVPNLHAFGGHLAERVARPAPNGASTRDYLAHRYADWSFLVVHLSPGSGWFPPVACRFPSRLDGLFVPRWSAAAGTPRAVSSPFTVYAQGSALRDRSGSTPGATEIYRRPLPPGMPDWLTAMQAEQTRAPAFPSFVDVHAPIERKVVFAPRDNDDELIPLATPL